MKCVSFTLLALLFLTGAHELRAGDIKGKVIFKGTKPKPVKIIMAADRRCERIHGGEDVFSDQVVVNGNGTLRNVFVYVKTGLSGKKYPPSGVTAKLDQTGCQYSPRVMGVMVDQKIEITNNDETLHNVHALPKNSRQFNIAQPKQGMKKTESFGSPEVMIRVKCDVHNWMAAYIGVLDHPFFSVSDDLGEFVLPDLPAGDYEVEAWHEKYGTRTMKVSVGSDSVKTADFTYEVD